MQNKKLHVWSTMFVLIFFALVALGHTQTMTVIQGTEDRGLTKDNPQERGGRHDHGFT
jgi:hypothetical protein